MSGTQSALIDQSFSTAAPANPIYCHQDFLERLEAYRNLPMAKRAALLMQSLAIDPGRIYFKGTRGENRGWRRSRLGGSQGSHFYAWWAPKSAPPLQKGEGFQDAPEGAIFLRDVRHHDDHSTATPQSFHHHYLPVSVPEIRREEYAPAPWTPAQARFATARSAVRILKGHPGSGKTTGLLHAADASGAERVLYVTYSRDLAVLARQYFDRFCSGQRRFHVVTFETFLRQLLQSDALPGQTSELRRRFRGDAIRFARQLGPWTDHLPALYDELHAHLVGAALPVAVGRFAACNQARVPEQPYRKRRERFLGETGVKAALDLVSRLERNESTSVAHRYFPDLALAWQAAQALASASWNGLAAEFLDFGCIAVDECQDLTPLEAFVLVELGATCGRTRGRPIPVLWAGDEAQTVRPTDFEWGWLNDLLHHRIGTPSEFKLPSNLRSPRRIALLVTRVWDLYAEIEKRDRPSGSGYVEIDDDATDQVFYCAAAPGPELDNLMTSLAAREGLALVTMDETARDHLPESVRSAVLTPSEVKGLDFHSICLVNAGKQLEAVSRTEFRFAYADIDSIRRRLAIDELRVALSRPSGRMIWVDISPTPKMVRTTLDFLNRDTPDCPVSASVPGAVRTALEEEDLGVEERVQRCQADARQFLTVRPELAWSRAQQAVSLLGQLGQPASIDDPSIRRAAFLTLGEIAFSLAFRNARLPHELGRPDLFQEAAFACSVGNKPGLGVVIRAIAGVMRAAPADRLQETATLAQTMARFRDALEPWLLVEIAGQAGAWVEEMESALAAGDNAVALAHLLPPFYEVLGLPDAAARTQRLLDRSVRFLLKHRRYSQALELLEKFAERRPDLEAECLEATGELARAAELYRSLGKLKEALNCYRAVPDFDAAMALLEELGNHPAAESYQWLKELREVIGRRPQNFGRVMQPSEKKVLEQILEQALGVARKAPARRATAKRTAKKPGARPAGN